MGEDDAVGTALRNSWRTIRLLVPVMFACVTVTVAGLVPQERGEASTPGYWICGVDGTDDDCRYEGDEPRGWFDLGAGDWPLAIIAGALTAAVAAIVTVVGRIAMALARRSAAARRAPPDGRT
jgi:hypothetical protein